MREGGNDNPPQLDFGEMTFEPPHGHSEYDSWEGGDTTNNPRDPCTPQSRKHLREKNSTDSELTLKRIHFGQGDVNLPQSDDISMENDTSENQFEGPPPGVQLSGHAWEGGVRATIL